MLEVRRTEADGLWSVRLQVVDWGTLSSAVARTSPQVAHYRPPVRTRTWFHTGVWLDTVTLEAQYAAEAWAGDGQAAVLGACRLPVDLSPTERKEAARALKGKLLRREVYADDGTLEASNPYVVTGNRYEVRTVQQRGNNRYGSFLAVPLESVSWQYERGTDPRVSHQLTLAVDDYGEVTLAAAVGYPRRAPAHPEQGACLVSVTERVLIYDDDPLVDRSHLALPATERVWELTEVTATDSAPFTAAGLFTSFAVTAVYPLCGGIRYGRSCRVREVVEV